jgi:ribosomal protein S27E
MIGEEQRLDGNVAGGLLQQIFVAEMTTARVVCAHCGQEGLMGEATVYASAMGTILRCAGCGEALIRAAQGPQDVRVDFSGVWLVRLRLPG